MSFPLIRPEDVEAMTEPKRQQMLVRLCEEMRAAAVRNREILAARKAAEEAVEAAHAVALRPARDFTDQEWIEAQQVLRARRVLVRQGRRVGDGTRADDLRAASAAVRAGSRNRYLLALERERCRLAKEASRDRAQRARQQARAAASARIVTPPTPDRRTA